MNFELNEEQHLIGQSAREFAKEFLDPIAADLDHSGEYPRDVIERLAGYDFLGLLLPEAVGGAGAGAVAYVAAIEEISQSCAAVATILNNHTLGSLAIAEWGNDTQKSEFVPPLAKGERLATLAIYENGPASGIGPDALLVSRQGDNYVLNGTKAFVRNAGVADLYVVFATLEPAEDKKGFSVFLVDGGTPGLTVAPRLETMGLNGCPVAHVVFNNVTLPAAALLGGENNGDAIAQSLLAKASLFEAAQTIGIGKAAVKHAAEYAKQRIQFGRPIAALQAIQTLLAEVATDCHLAWLGVQRTAQLIEDGEPFATDAAIVKAFLARFGSKMLIDSCQVEGGFGYSEFMPLPRLFRDIAGTTLLDAPADFPDKIIADSIA
ncbi:acyl-CoA dehydrogenase family protein [Brenneria goodwinii]|uniref:Butyryl-CoA dehydrogenase n=1 Tax=Brenneria goodwinii TaxID=1109412 RepID=A0A0G4JYX2_9GAMM|nr:acyl-CoA dehydrogenase family protein [Brenneria goodwinii]MCG8157230.1 acyl-CoA dehydrogenase family protein [Brenneria goodwinii]MCG8162184.1 acyl-CoA dehydrogenase family protein [Brenneria goodwinii]MCG8166114.1 acyl-CoA dehydrogenase family protein [Brenneria goodwinii]MCG8170741.1 acyl-CoA dehydrogenase family protein [Brenneria goodwinii]MCG8175810.1 acyl-CoA dehydrogenase family protein [Brenneria goodwinii]